MPATRRPAFFFAPGPTVTAVTFALSIDVKTTESAHPDDFAKSVANYGYHSQEGLYTDVAELLGQPVDAFVFIGFERIAHGRPTFSKSRPPWWMRAAPSCARYRSLRRMRTPQPVARLPDKQHSPRIAVQALALSRNTSPDPADEAA